MDENDVINTMVVFLKSKFPITCNCCGKRYTTLEEYLLLTTHTGKPVSYDADETIPPPKKPLGTYSMANCSCGSTMAISSKGMNIITFWKLMNWARHESKKRGITINDLLEDVRRKIDLCIIPEKINHPGS